MGQPGAAMPRMTRADKIAGFLREAGWDAAASVPLAGDASARRYDRLTDPTGATAILMDADPETGERTVPFVHIARHLRTSGFSAPQILAWNKDDGLILMEDLGDALITTECAARPHEEPGLYAHVARFLCHLQKSDPPAGLERYNPSGMAEKIAPFHQHYDQITTREAHALRIELQAVLEQTSLGDNVLIHRDFHAENLLWLPNREGRKRIGILDFQDAMLGDPAYDLTSLILDARRDVSTKAADAATEAFCDATGHSLDAVHASIAAQGAQRNMRILGIFARLIAAGKPKYVAFEPRVRANLAQCLGHPKLANVRRVIARVLPNHGPWAA